MTGNYTVMVLENGHKCDHYLANQSKALSYIWRACFQSLLHPPRHVTHLHYWLPFAIKIVPSLIKYVPIEGYFHLT